MRLCERPRNHHRDVILLFSSAELLDCSDDCLEQWTHRKMTIRTKGVDQSGLAELFALGAPGFRYSVGIQNERVSRGELHLRNLTMPVIK